MHSCMACSALPGPGHHQGACQQHMALLIATSQHTACTECAGKCCLWQGACHTCQQGPLGSCCSIQHTISTTSDPPCLTTCLPACLHARL